MPLLCEQCVNNREDVWCISSLPHMEQVLWHFISSIVNMQWVSPKEMEDMLIIYFQASGRSNKIFFFDRPVEAIR